EPRTLVFFEAPHRIAAALADARDAMGPERRAAVCRELTKKFEEIARGTLAELADRFAEGARGEIVLVIEGAPARSSDLPTALAEVADRVAAGERLKDAAAAVAAATGLGTRELYEAALAARRA
ncbi:MAG: rRNA ((1402)-2-O)-methyltransferase, partial [Actinomycetota bacterium]